MYLMVLAAIDDDASSKRLSEGASEINKKIPMATPIDGWMSAWSVGPSADARFYCINGSPLLEGHLCMSAVGTASLRFNDVITPKLQVIN